MNFPPRGIPRAVSNLDLDLRESSRGLTIENGSILAIWDRFRSSNRGALARSKFQIANRAWYIQLALVFFLTSCFSGSEHAVVQGLVPKKQKQKIAVLQKKLELAEKDRKKAHDEVEKLASEINEARLSLIRRQVDDYEKKGEKAFRLFLEEREALYRMIQTGPSPAAFEAQVELDRILRLITELSDEGKNV